MRRREERQYESREERLADNFVYHLERLLHRVGVRNGVVKADRYVGRIENVSYKHNGHRRNRPVKTNRARRRRVYSPDEIEALLRHRLSRLLKECNYRFGCIKIPISEGRVRWCDFTVKTRPGEEQMTRFFCT